LILLLIIYKLILGIDVDEHNYPKGAGKVIFNNQNSYMRAVAAKFIEIKSGKIQKYIQIDPFVQDSLCSLCQFQRGKFFCRDANCFWYVIQLSFNQIVFLFTY